MFTSKQIEKSTPDTTISNVVELTVMSEMSKSEILIRMVGKLMMQEFRNCVITPAFHLTDNLDVIPVMLISSNATDTELNNSQAKVYRTAQILNEVLDITYTPMRINHSTVLVGLTK